jgi:predicted dehydrogenase
MLKVGVIGAGYWGPNLVRNFREIGALSIVCDSDTTKLEKIKKKYRDVETTESIERLIDASDAVVIATGGASHYKLAKLVLEHNKDVFVEKPLALSLEDGEHLVELAKDRNRILMVGHLLLYHPAVRMLKEYMDDEVLGTIRYIYSQRVNLGRIREDENALWSFGPHDISVILYLLQEEPTRVMAIGESYLMKDVPDVVFLVLCFRRKMLVHIHLSWLDPHKMRKFTIVGDKKMVVFDDMEASEKIKLYDKGVDFRTEFTNLSKALSLRSGDILIPKVDNREPLSIECREFVDCVAKRKTPLSDGQLGLNVLKVLDSAQRSLDTGGTWIHLENQISKFK